MQPETIEAAFDEIHQRGPQLDLPEPRLRDTRGEEEGSIKLINDLIDSLAGPYGEVPWSLQAEAASMEQAERQINRLRADVWEPFERCARVLDHFGYLDFQLEQVTDRGRWLADLRVDRPLLVGEALQRGLFAALKPERAAALIAAIAADADRDYGELELDDAMVSLLVQFEQIAFEVSTEEWKQGVEAAPEINFSAAAAVATWAAEAEWTELVRETRAEEGDLVRLLSRTGEALLQVAGLRETHPAAASTARTASELMLRDPVR